VSGAGARTRNARGEGDRLRSALLDAARELLVELGSVERLTIRNITARAGVTPTALYLHFADKPELVHALLDEGWAELLSQLQAAQAEHEGDPRAQLAAMAGAYVTFALERPALYTILFGTYIPGEKIMPIGGATDDPDPGLRTFDELMRAVGRCIEDDRDPFETSILLWAALHGYVTLKPVMPSFPLPDVDTYFSELYRAYIEPR
jgi:AcrR family transcriptional regulator